MYIPPSFTHALIHANFTSHIGSSPLPFPPTHDSLSLHHSCIQGGQLHSICLLSHLFLGLFLLKSDDQEIDGALYFWDHHTPIQIVAKPDCTCIFIVAISKSCAKAQGLQKPSIRFITIKFKNPCILGECLFSTVNINKPQQMWPPQC